MKDRTKNILGIIGLVAIAGALLVYGRPSQPTIETTEPSVTLEPIVSEDGSAPVVEVGDDKLDAKDPVVDTTPHTHPVIGTVAAQPAGVDAAVYANSKTQMQKAIDALKTNSRDYQAWLDLAIHEYSVFKNEKRAEEIWLFVEKDRPAMVQSVANLANLYFQRGNTAKAIEYLQKTVKNEPKFLQGYTDLHDIYQSQNSTQKAIQILLDGMAANPKDHSLAVTLARYYKDLGKIAEARAQYDIAYTRAQESGNQQLTQVIDDERKQLSAE